jgi:hypothetical protein
MGRSWRLGSRTAAVLLAPATLVAACSRREPPARLGSPSGNTSAGVAHSASSVPSAGTANTPTPVAAPRASARPAATSVVEAKNTGVPGLTLGELFDVGPAGPATATSEGVVLLTRDDRVFVAERSPGKRPDQTKIAVLDAPAAAFSALARAPGVAAGHAYWISHGRLVRRALDGDGPLEVLDADARDGSRASAVAVNRRVAVAFLGRADTEGTSHARLWLDDGQVLDLTPDGAGASSVALTRVGDHLLATAIDGRSAMTPLHARPLRVEPAGVTLGDDVVVWVGGPAQAWTETVVGAEAGHARAYLPIERDITHFGLANVDLGLEPHMDSDVAFFDYANGIDLAPVATAELCGHAHVVFARPTASAPHSPEELVLVRPNTNEAVSVADARVFVGASLVAVPGGGLLAYVADGRTWARGLGCR